MRTHTTRYQELASQPRCDATPHPTKVDKTRSANFPYIARLSWPTGSPVSSHRYAAATAARFAVAIVRGLPDEPSPCNSVVTAGTMAFHRHA